MIRRLNFSIDVIDDLFHSLRSAHPDISRIVGILNAPPATVKVWTYTDGLGPIPDGEERYSASGWVQHFAGQRQRLVQIRQRLAAGTLADIHPNLPTAAQDFAQDIVQAGQAIQTAIDRHGGLQEELTVPERTQLAAFLAGLLEA